MCFASIRAAMLGLLLGAIASAQQTAHPDLIGTGEFPVARLLELASRQLHCSMLIAPGAEATLPPIRVTEPIRTDLELELGRLLFPQKLTVMPIDARLRLFEVVALDGSRFRAVLETATWKSPDEVLRQPSSKQVVTTVVSVSHNPVACAAALGALQQQKQLVPLEGSVAAGNAAIVLRGLQDQVATAIAVVRQADQAAPAVAPAGQLEARLAGLDKQVAEVEKQIAELQQKKPGTTGK